MKAKELLHLCDGNFCTVIIGTEKNAGKTTVLNAILEETDDCVGITGIGRDGESVDLVTGTDKPAIFVKEGTIVATAKNLLKECTCSRRILASTDITTPLGDVVIFRAENDGFVQIAGPGIVSKLVTIRGLFTSSGVKRMFVDGALSRKTFSACSLADAVILATGASSTPDMYEAAEYAAFIASTFFYPLAVETVSLPAEECSGYISGRLVENGDIRKLCEVGANDIRIAGALTDSVLNKLCSIKRKFEVTVADPGKILSSKEVTERFLNRGNVIRLKARPRLLAVTTNPYSAKGHHYDAKKYKAAVAERVSVPVFDVKGDA